MRSIQDAEEVRVTGNDLYLTEKPVAPVPAPAPEPNHQVTIGELATMMTGIGRTPVHSDQAMGCEACEATPPTMPPTTPPAPTYEQGPRGPQWKGLKSQSPKVDTLNNVLLKDLATDMASLATYAQVLLRRVNRQQQTLPDSMLYLCRDLRRCIEMRSECALLVELHQENCNMRKAQLLLGVDGKNKAQRAAQLTLDLYSDEEYQLTLRTLAKSRGELSAAEAALDSCRTHISLLRAYLLSQASQTVIE